MLLRLLLSCFMMLLLSACDSTSDMTAMPPDPMPDISQTSTANSISSVSPPHQIALLLPLQGDLSGAGKAIQAGFNDAYQQSHVKPVIKVYDTSQTNDINSLYDTALQAGANYVVGPLDKIKVAALEHYHNIKVITIALNNPDTPFYTPNLYEFALSPTDEARQVADKAAKEGYSKALLITPEGSWGQNIADTMQKRWEDNNGVVVGSVSLSGDSDIQDEIQTLLEVQGNQRREDFDVIFMVVQPRLARQIRPLLKYYHADNVPVYGTSLVYSGLLNPKKDQGLNGVKFCDIPLVLDSQGKWAALRQEITLSQSTGIQKYIRLYGLGYDAALLTQNFGALQKGFSGSTGVLTVNSHNDILRKLNFAVFENGLPQTVS